jgi:peptidoglycan/LPS O-acetylase OafA/YrhL
VLTAIKRQDIQVIRGIAVIAVLLFHAKESYFPNGYLGVDGFFVVSGFVMTPLIIQIFSGAGDRENRRLRFRTFLRRRFFRLAPAMAMCLLMSGILIFLFAPIGDHVRIAKQALASLALLGNLGALIFSGDYFNPNPNPLIHLWSLSVEEQIYLALPFALLVFFRRNTFQVKKVVFLWVTITIVSFLLFMFPRFLETISLSEIPHNINQLIGFYSPISRLWQFTVGGLGYLVISKNSFNTKKLPIIFLVLPGMLVGILLFSPLRLDSLLASFIISMLTLLSIVFQSFERFPLLMRKLFVWLGDRSYSIYLFHMPFIYLAKYSQVAGIGDGENRKFQTFIAVALSIAVGSVSYSQIENRYRETEANSPVFLNHVKQLLAIFFGALTIILLLLATGSGKYWADRQITKTSNISELAICSKVSNLEKICTSESSLENPTLLLIGDSHADHLAEAILGASRLSDWNFLYKPSTTIESVNLSLEGSFSRFLRDARPDLIIISQYWKSSSDLNLIKKQISRITSLGPEVLFIENTPVWPDISRYNLSGFVITNYEIPKTFKVEKMDRSDEAASKELAHWSRKSGLLTADLSSLFCNEVECSRYASNRWLFSDYNHLSREGALMSVGLLKELFLRIDFDRG